MRVGMHEMHALRVRGFFHDNDMLIGKLVRLLQHWQLLKLVGGVMTPPYRVIITPSARP